MHLKFNTCKCFIFMFELVFEFEHWLCTVRKFDVFHFWPTVRLNFVSVLFKSNNSIYMLHF